MPRFGAEAIPNSLKEMMWRQELNNLMFNPLPAEQHGGAADQTMQALRRMEAERDRYSATTDPVNPNSRFDDSKTAGQQSRDRRALEEGFLYSKPDMTNPYHQNNQPAWRDVEMGGGNTAMDRLYNEMPPNLPRYPGMVVPTPDLSPEMGQLMDFYTNEGI